MASWRISPYFPIRYGRCYHWLSTQGAGMIREKCVSVHHEEAAPDSEMWETNNLEQKSIIINPSSTESLHTQIWLLFLYTSLHGQPWILPRFFLPLPSHWAGSGRLFSCNFGTSAVQQCSMSGQGMQGTQGRTMTSTEPALHRDKGAGITKPALKQLARLARHWICWTGRGGLKIWEEHKLNFSRLKSLDILSTS